MFAAVSLPTLCRAKEPGISLQLDPTVLVDWKTTAVWYGHLLARAKYREDHKLPRPQSGIILPTLDEEVYARMTAAQIYEKLKGENHGYFDAYWEALSQIKSKGFMNAYVWTYLHQSNWPASQQPKKLSAFQTWSHSHLKNHKAMTYGALSAENK